MKLPQSRRYLATLIGVSCGMTSFLSAAQTSPSTEPAPQVQNQAESKASGDTMVVTAAEQTRQAPGVSVITAEDISKRPPANDLSDLIRTMPASTCPVTQPAASAVTTARSISAAWDRKIH